MGTHPKTALKKQAYDAIKKMILFGQLKPGQLINEAELQEIIGIGRTPVREALLNLSQDMLVIIHPRKGIEVAAISPKKINEIFEIRMVLEVEMLRSHMQKLDRDWLEGLHQQFLALSKIDELDEDTIRHIIGLDDQFHSGIVNASNNAIAGSILGGFFDYLMLLRVTTTSDQMRHIASEKEHLQIIESILNGDTGKACTFLKDHLEISWKATLDSYIQGAQ